MDDTGVQGAALPPLSPISYGAAPLGNMYGDIDPAIGIRSVHCAIDRGITFFDVSPYYGHRWAEEVLGQALVGRRHEIVLCTKVGRYEIDRFDFSYSGILRSMDESLRRLRTDSVDVLLAHDIEFGEPLLILGETIDALAALKAQGKAKYIGVSGYPLDVLQLVMERRELDVVLSYCHYCLFNTQLVDTLGPAAQRRGTALLNASPLGMGLLTDDPARTPPPTWHPAPQALREASARAAALCRERGASLSTLALQFSLQAPIVRTTVVGMPTPELVERNVAVLDTPLDPELLNDVLAIFASVSQTNWPSGRAEWDGTGMETSGT